MERTYVESSALVSIGFDSSTSTLEIEFKGSGQLWQYRDVPEYVWYEFCAAPSAGKYFNANIKNQYAGTRIG